MMYFLSVVSADLDLRLRSSFPSWLAEKGGRGGNGVWRLQCTLYCTVHLAEHNIVLYTALSLPLIDGDGNL